MVYKKWAHTAWNSSSLSLWFLVRIFSLSQDSNQTWRDKYHYRLALTDKAPSDLQPHYHSDLDDQNLFHSTIDVPPGVSGVSKNQDDQTEVHSGELEH